MRIVIGVPHCRFVINKPNGMQTIEYFAIHKQDSEGNFVGVSIKVSENIEDSSIHTTAEIIETYSGLSYSKLAERVKNLSKTNVRELIDEMTASGGPVYSVNFDQSRFGREAATLYEDELLEEVKTIFKKNFDSIKSELSEMILGIDEFAAYKGVQGSW